MAEAGERWEEVEGLHLLTIREVREAVDVSNVITQETEIDQVAEIINRGLPLEDVQTERTRLKEHAFAGVKSMPLYSYRCGACHTTREILAKMSDPPPQVCDACGAEGQMTKLLARTSFQLKGSGWYSQGYEGASNRQSESHSGDGGSTSSDGGGASDASTGGTADRASSNSGSTGSSTD